jgi:hypothetical protein
MTGEITAAQRVAAKWVGAILLILMATAMFAELYLLNGIGSADGATMAANVAGSEGRYRAGAVVHMLTFAGDAAMAAALYAVLSPVSRQLALTGAFLRLAQCTILALSTSVSFAILKSLGDPELVQALYSLQSAMMRVGWMFLGLGSAVFALAWWRSGYVPKVLAGWGVFASLLLAAGPVANMLQPGVAPAMAYMGPMFFYEVPMGLWLLVRGLKGHS